MKEKTNNGRAALFILIGTVGCTLALVLGILYGYWLLLGAGIIAGLVALRFLVVPVVGAVVTGTLETVDKAVDTTIKVQTHRHTMKLQERFIMAEYDALGNPVIPLDVQTGRPIAYLPFGNAPVAQIAAPRRTRVEEETPQEEVLQIAAPIPSSVRYEDVQSQVPTGHALLGVDGTGVKTCDFSQILTCLILGGSGTGKSNTVAIKVEEAIRDGWKIILCDPHKHKPDSLYNRIKEYSHAFLKFPGMQDGIAVREEEIKAAYQWFINEFENRMQGKGQGYDVLIITDEVGRLMDSDDDELKKMVKKVARICGTESRDFGMAGWFINQNPIGIAWLRNVVMTVIVHKVNMMNQRKIAANENMEVARSMDNWPKGRVAIYGLFVEGIHELQMPLKTQATRVVEADTSSSAHLPHDFQTTEQRETEALPEANAEAAGRSNDENSGVTDLSTIKTLREIGKRLKAGDDKAKIIKDFGLPYGRATQEMSAVVDMVAEQIEREG